VFFCEVKIFSIISHPNLKAVPPSEQRKNKTEGIDSIGLKKFESRSLFLS